MSEGTRPIYDLLKEDEGTRLWLRRGETGEPLDLQIECGPDTSLWKDQFDDLHQALAIFVKLVALKREEREVLEAASDD